MTKVDFKKDYGTIIGVLLAGILIVLPFLFLRYGQGVVGLENSLNTHNIWIDVITIIMAGIIGYFQIKINHRMKRLQDYVAIAATPGENMIKFLNAGKINLYLWGSDEPGDKQRLDESRLIPANIGKDVYYWLKPAFPSSMSIGDKFKLKLYLTDEFGKKWVSEHGGEIINKTGQEDSPLFGYTIWTYKIKREEWTFKDKK